MDKIVREMEDTFFLNSLAVAVNRIEVDDNNIEGPITNDGVYDCATNVTKYGLLKKKFHFGHQKWRWYSSDKALEICFISV